MPGTPSPKEKAKFWQRLGKGNPLQSFYAVDQLLSLRFRAARSNGRSIGKANGPDDCMILIGIPLASALGGPMSGLILDHTHWFGLDGHTAFRSVPSAGPVLRQPALLAVCGKHLELLIL
jgi:hypothetical protein